MIEGISHNEENINLQLSKIYGFIITFYKKMDALANRYGKYKNNYSTYDGEHPIDAGIETILSEFNLDEREIDFLSNMILTKQKNKTEDKDIDLSFMNLDFDIIDSPTICVMICNQ